jgi:hypothetical protein
MLEEMQEYLPIVGLTVGSLVILKIAFSICKIGFKRDAIKCSFSSNPFIALSSLLSNKDSVLERGGVEESIDGYENLFDGKSTKNKCDVPALKLSTPIFQWREFPSPIVFDKQLLSVL